MVERQERESKEEVDNFQKFLKEGGVWEKEKVEEEQEEVPSEEICKPKIVFKRGHEDSEVEEKERGSKVQRREVVQG